MRIRELPEEHELLRRWCEGLDQEYRGQRLAGLAHKVFLKLLKAKREVPTAAGGPGRAAGLVRAVWLHGDAERLRAGPRCAGAAALRRQRAAAAGALR